MMPGPTYFHECTNCKAGLNKTVPATQIDKEKENILHA